MILEPNSTPIVASCSVLKTLSVNWERRQVFPTSIQDEETEAIRKGITGITNNDEAEEIIKGIHSIMGKFCEGFP